MTKAATRLVMVVAMAVVMVSMMATTVRARCSPRVNGCSIPFGLPFFYKRLFTPACNRHDVCYECGARRGRSRRDCDNAFLRDMLGACSSTGRRRGTCRFFADKVYYAAVRGFGRSHYNPQG